MKKRRDPRRSYGYIDPNQEPEPKIAPKKQILRRPERTRIQSPTEWSRIFLFPFRLIWYILKYIFTVLGWIWRKIARISKKNKGIGKQLFSTGLVAGVLLIIIGIGYTAWISRDLPDPDRLTDRKVAESTKIYDRTGEELLYEIFADEKRTIIDLEEIPDKLIKGVIATEDTKFYEHKGIRPLSILRAFAYGIFTKRRIAGTSTLTQQLVKNAILTDERKLTRKIKEAILSVQLERKYSKDQILKIYFNEIPYGSTNYGIEAAAQSYFGKHVSDLDLQEMATLAGLPKAPTTYLRDKDALKQRRNFVLRRMFEEGYITKEEKEETQAEPVTLERRFSDIKAPHFVLHVREQLVEEYGEQTVDTGGLRVITSLDWDKQQIAEKAVEEAGTKALDNAEANNTSLVAIDPKTGHILAMIGSRDFYNDEIDGQFNVATLGKRQPGSSFKPIIYTAAFEKGYTPETVLFDVVTNFAASGRAYTPRNYDLSEHGPVSMRQALQGSLNIPAVKTLYLVGLKQGINFAERLGYTTLSDGNFGLTLVLGGGEVKLLDHVSAYGIFANSGVAHKPISILRVEDNKGDILQEWKQKKGERVLDSSVAATISNILSDDNARAYAFGTGSILTLPGRRVAAKTGTTNNYIDAWTIGYTPSLVAGVWAGNTDNTPMKRGFGGSKVAGPIWNQFMREALDGTVAEGFPAPPTNDAKKAALRGSQGGGITLSIDKVTGKLATSSTPEKYIVERTYIQPHSILHYVNKDNPRGAFPENPNDNPQYSGWEAGIQGWITRKKEEDPDWEVSFEESPTEYDDAHSLELIPTLTVVYPAPSSTISSRQIDTDIRVTAERGVAKVTYKIDEKYVGVIRYHPFNLNYHASDLDPGQHTLTIIVEDDVGNTIEEVVSFTFEGSAVEPSVSWFGGNKTVQAGTEATLFLNHVKLDQISEIRVYEKDGEKNKKHVVSISDFSNLFNNQIMVKWNAPSTGNWQLIAEIVLEGGGQKESGRLHIKVE